MTEAEAGVTQLRAKDHQGVPATTRAGDRQGRTLHRHEGNKGLSLQIAEQAQPSRSLDLRLLPAQP